MRIVHCGFLLLRYVNSNFNYVFFSYKNFKEKHINVSLTISYI